MIPVADGAIQRVALDRHRRHILEQAAEPLLALSQGLLGHMQASLGFNAAEHPVHHAGQAIDQVRVLEHVVGRAQPHHVDGQALVALPRHHDEIHVDAASRQRGHDLASGHVRKFLIQQQHLGGIRRKALDGLGSARRSHRFHADLAQRPQDQVSQPGIVLHDEDPPGKMALLFPLSAHGSSRSPLPNGTWTTARNSPSCRMAWTKSSYSTGLVM